MSWPIHRWLFVIVSLFLFKGCQNLFLRHSDSGKCITASEELAYNESLWAFPYFVVMTDNCLNVSAQFRYLDSPLLHNIEKNGTLISTSNIKEYQGRWAVYKGVAADAITIQNGPRFRVKQTDSGSLFSYDTRENVCAEPSTKYVLRNATCDTEKQKVTFGSVTAYNAKMEYVHCSPKQKMVVKSADYGDFNKNGAFNDDENFDTTCSKLANCQVKSRCGGNRSCELTMDKNLLPSEYCSDTLKEIYTKYTCVDTYNSSTITTAPKIRLSRRNTGFIEIKQEGWRKVVEENWDKNRQKMLCQHLGFEETADNKIVTKQLESGQNIATGDLICYNNTQQSGTSCCIHLQPSISNSSTTIPDVKCKICDKPLLHDANTFPDSIFSGSGDLNNNYKHARITKSGWCPLGTGTRYLMLDLHKQYHITKVVVMADIEQASWSGSYSLKYSHDKTLVDGSSAIPIKGNKYGYQASITSLHIHNVRYMQIESTVNQSFCLRIELCGEVECVNNEDSKILMDLLIPLVILVLCFLLSLGVIIYQRRLIKNNNRHPCRKCETSEQANQNRKFERIERNEVESKPEICTGQTMLDAPSSNIMMKGIQAPNDSYENDDDAYESPDSEEGYVIECIAQNEVESKPETSAGQESSTYMSLKDNRESGNFYQPLQPPGNEC
ncbi:uncharacterized protein LOC110250238 [Paramuricea clavata]|uniref:Uncharacterized protein LOC110250238 n=1 Tax=Paramuricea clavata TaxID=317549 RepID=A0A6S7HNA9_PARCT|nr:uncharacterized protein LOC110250238 [Paramuricea clavata]